MTECNEQVDLFSIGRRTVTVSATGEFTSSDAGVLLLREIDRELGLIEGFAGTLIDRRDASRVSHTFEDLLRQRCYQVACGYEDANDAGALRQDAGFVAALGGVPGQDTLASQPSLSRFEGQSIGNVVRISLAMIDAWADRIRRKGRKAWRQIILDFDSTDDPTHGAQQLSMFHGFYDQYMYHPLLVFDGEGWPVAVMLRPGRAHNEGAVGLLLRIFQRIVEKLPASARILVRADGGFATPEMYEVCETLGIEYVIGLPSNSVVRDKLEPAMKRARDQFRRTGIKAQEFDAFEYRARSWSCKRRVIGKAEVMAEGDNPRFVVTNRRGSPKAIYRLYGKRGQSENWIKDLKNAMFGDRLSCHRFASNQFRLVIHTIAYMLMFALRERQTAKELRRVQLDTLRLRLIKIGATIRVTARRIWVVLSRTHPNSSVWIQTARQFAAPG